MAKFGATKHLASPPAPSTFERSSSRSKPVAPTTAWTPASMAFTALTPTVSGVENSTITSAPSSASSSDTPSSGSALETTSMPSAASTASTTVEPMRPAAPETTTRIASAIP